MTETEPQPDNVLQLKAQFDTPSKTIKGAKKADKRKKAKDSGGDGGEPPGPAPTMPKRLPHDAPVKSLGTRDGIFYYLDHLGQLRQMKATDHGRTQFLDLFGGNEYLNATWPIWEKTDAGWVRKDDFKHAAIAPAMMGSCGDLGVWDPTDKVRGCGTWVEESGALVMHCGRHLYRTAAGKVFREEAGIFDTLLYPRRPALSEPDFKDTKEAGPRLLDMLDTWTWKRRDIDPKLALGWNVAAMLGQAPPWRPMMWVTGSKATGKSTLFKLFDWLQGGALIKPTNTTQAYVYQKIGDSALPVALDEFEAKEDNRRVDDVIELMRIAASGGELGRGGSENNPKTYTLKSCFIAFSILIPPLAPQDISRMAILALKPLERRDEAEEFDLTAPAEHDLVLGPRDKWAKTGRQLRGRVLEQWPRYLQTFNAYFHALVKVGHDSRAASQFGSLGAAYDIAMFDALEVKHAQEWAQMLPAAELAETKGYANEPEGCLGHLLAAKLDARQHGTLETVAHYLRRARKDLETNAKTNDPDDACRILAKHGIRVTRDAKLVTIEGDVPKPLWWVNISNTHAALNEIFKGTKWRGRAGAPGTWKQALSGLNGAAEKAREMRIDGLKNWVTAIMFDCVLPPFNEHDDAEEIATVIASDREKTANERPDHE